MAVLSPLHLDELRHCRTILSNYSFPHDSLESSEFRLSMNENLEHYKIWFSIVNKTIWDAMEKRLPWIYNDVNKSVELLSAGSSAYLGLLIYRVLSKFNRREGKYKEDELLDVDIVLIYLACDFILDSEDIPSSVKTEMKRRVETYKNDPHHRETQKDKGDYRVNDLIDILEELLTLEPNCREGIFDAWDSEKKSEEQLHCKDFETLWEISSNKGYRTVQMAAKIINCGNDLPHSYILGALTQVCDDLMDHQSDKDAGINTAATLCMTDGQCLDYYIYRCLILVSEVPKEFWPLSFFFTQVICSCGFHNNYTSKEMKRLCGYYLFSKKKYNLEDFVSRIIS